MLGQSGNGAGNHTCLLHLESHTRYDSAPYWALQMRCVRFEWNPVLIELRREVCPNARWQKQGRHWLMTDADAERFIQTAQARLDFQRWQASIRIDDITWVVGFVKGAPYRLPPPELQKVASTDRRAS